MALIDTGAQAEVCGQCIAKSLDGETIIGPKTKLVGAFSSAEQILEWKRCKMELRGTSIWVNFAILPTLGPVMILGMPFLDANGGIIDLQNNIIRLNNHWLELETAEYLYMVTTFKEIGVLVISVLNQKDWNMLNKTLSEATELSDGGKVLLESLFLRYNETWEGERIGNTTVAEHKIELTTKRAVVQRPRRIPLDRQSDIDKELEDMLIKEVIRPSGSCFASEVVLVKKKDGAWRFCIDFRALNKVTVPDKHPLPRIQDLLRAVRGSCFFVTLDLRAGYWQIPVAEESIYKTAFRTHRGLFEWIRMPFGLINAPASFQRLMEQVLGDLHYSGVLVYIDDILIHAETEAQTLNLTEVVFQRLSESNLTLKLEKSSFFHHSIPYLGHVLERGRILPNPERVLRFQNIKRPTSIKELRSLLGHFGYYRDYIPRFAQWAKPLTDMLKKGSKCEWRPEFEEILAYFQQHLGDTCLNNPLITDEFLLETDASETALGAILSCRSKPNGPWRPVEFASHALSDVETRWPAHEREAFAIIYALERFDHFLRGRQFRVYTDNRSLEFLDKAQKGKLARWAARMAEYTLEIYHKSGSQMTHVDFLSRYVEPEEKFLADRMLPFLAFPTENEITLAQQTENFVLGKGYLKREGIVFYRGKVYVPTSLREQVMRAAHSMPPLLHPGTRKTKATILKLFNWPNVHGDVSRWIKQCVPCQRLRPGIEKLQSALRQHSPSEILNRVYMDFWSVTVRQQNHTFLTMIDWASRWVECVHLEDKTAESVTSAFLKNWVCRFGAPKELITDNESTFMSAVFDGICKRIGINKVRTTLYHPEGNAPIESFHKTLRKGLRIFCLERKNNLDIDEAVQLVCLSYRSTVHLNLGDSPAFRLMGTDPRPPAADSDWRLFPPSPDQERLRFLTLHRLEIYQRAQAAYEVQKVARDKESKPEFEMGNLVLSRLRPLEVDRYAERDGNRKLVPTFSAPYRVIRIYRNGQTAMLQPLAVQGRLKEVHIKDCRFLLTPTPERLKEWEKMSIEEQTVFEPVVRRQIIEEKFVSVERPQKRRRI
jgi:transposase InsO family protein